MKPGSWVRILPNAIGLYRFTVPGTLWKVSNVYEPTDRVSVINNTDLYPEINSFSVWADNIEPYSPFELEIELWG